MGIDDNWNRFLAAGLLTSCLLLFCFFSGGYHRDEEEINSSNKELSNSKPDSMTENEVEKSEEHKSDPVRIKNSWNAFRAPVSEAFVEVLKKRSFSENDHIIISSRGGANKAGLDLGEFLQKQNLNIAINGKFGPCFSACAEFVLPAAKKVHFKNNPLIGYHWSPQVDRHLFETANHAQHKVELCDSLNSDVQRTVALLKRRNLKTDLWKQTFERLELEYFQPSIMRHSCQAGKRKFRHELWLPNSQQLKTYLDLNFTGDLCADYPQSCAKKIDEYFSKGISVVIGESIYISKGSTTP